MRDIAREEIEGFWKFVKDNDLEVVDCRDDLCVYLDESNVKEFCNLYVRDFEKRKQATICPDGSIYIEVLGELLDGYGITYERLKEFIPDGFEFS